MRGIPREDGILHRALNTMPSASDRATLTVMENPRSWRCGVFGVRGSVAFVET